MSPRCRIGPQVRHLPEQKAHVTFLGSESGCRRIDPPLESSLKALAAVESAKLTQLFGSSGTDGSLNPRIQLYMIRGKPASLPPTLSVTSLISGFVLPAGAIASSCGPSFHCPAKPTLATKSASRAPLHAANLKFESDTLRAALS